MQIIEYIVNLFKLTILIVLLILSIIVNISSFVIFLSQNQLHGSRILKINSITFKLLFED